MCRWELPFDCLLSGYLPVRTGVKPVQDPLDHILAVGRAEVPSLPPAISAWHSFTVVRIYCSFWGGINHLQHLFWWSDYSVEYSAVRYESQHCIVLFAFIKYTWCKRGHIRYLLIFRLVWRPNRSHVGIKQLRLDSASSMLLTPLPAYHENLSTDTLLQCVQTSRVIKKSSLL